VRRLFEVNSEPHTGARPSVRLCVGLIILIFLIRILVLVLVLLSLLLIFLLLLLIFFLHGGLPHQ